MLSGSDYKTIFDGNWDSQGAQTAAEWDRSSNGGNMGNPSGMWDYKGKEMTFSKVKGEDNAYSVNIKLNYSYKTTGKGAKEGQKDINISQTIETGIKVRQKDQFTYKSDNVQ